MLNRILAEAKDLQEELVVYRRHLHANPELGMALPKTVAYVKEQLTKIGLETQDLCESGFVVLIGGKKPGKVVLLRADMDALPITEATDEPFCSTNGAMHACGHDLHTAMLLGAARILKNREDEIPGTVKLMFQPAEEILMGSQAMLEGGVLANPKVDMAMMIHVGTGIPLPDGVVIKPEAGVVSATSDLFKIEIQGKGGHGAMPESTVDPLITASAIHLGLQAINTREVPAAQPIVITVGKLQGGSAPNIIPDTALLEGSIRTFSNEHREFVKKRIVEISEGIAASYRAKAEVTYSHGCPSVLVDGEGAEVFSQTATELFGEQSVLSFADVMPGGKLMGSEDFAFVTEKVPSVMASLATGSSKEGYIYPHHHPKTKFSEGMMHRGTALYAGFAMQYLMRNQENV